MHRICNANAKAKTVKLNTAECGSLRPSLQHSNMLLCITKNAHKISRVPSLRPVHAPHSRIPSVLAQRGAGTWDLSPSDNPTPYQKGGMQNP